MTALKARSFWVQREVGSNQMKVKPSAMNSQGVSKTDVAPAMAPVVAPMAEEPVGGGAPHAVSHRQIISKAAIRRLAHDVGVRLAKDAHQTALEDLEKYVMTVMQHAAGAMSFSRRKSVSLNHILFAAGVCGGVPASLRSMQAEDLKRLSKCNPQAPPTLRKDVLWRAEISEASFSKVAKRAAKQCHATLRITSQARRMLQLLAEYHVMKGFDKRGTLGKPEEANPLIQNMMNVFECNQETGGLLADVVQEVCSRIPELLAMGSVKTIDDRLVRTSLAPTRPWVQDWNPPEKFVECKTVKVVERILRGRAADKRVTVSACTFLASCFQRVVMESRGEVAPCGEPKPARAAAKNENVLKKVAKAKASPKKLAVGGATKTIDKEARVAKSAATPKVKAVKKIPPAQSSSESAPSCFSEQVAAAP